MAVTITGADIAAIISSLTAMIIGIGTLAQTRKNARTLDAAAVASAASTASLTGKLDANTTVTEVTAAKVEQLHASTDALIANSGVFRSILAPEPK